MYEDLTIPMLQRRSTFLTSSRQHSISHFRLSQYSSIVFERSGSLSVNTIGRRRNRGGEYGTLAMNFGTAPGCADYVLGVLLEDALI